MSAAEHEVRTHKAQVVATDKDKDKNKDKDAVVDDKSKPGSKPERKDKAESLDLGKGCKTILYGRKTREAEQAEDVELEIMQTTQNSILNPQTKEVGNKNGNSVCTFSQIVYFEEERKKAFDANADITINPQVKVSAQIKTATNLSKKEFLYIARYKQVKAVEVFKSESVSINSKEVEKLLELDSQEKRINQFYEEYGDSYITRVERGSEYSIFIKFTAKNKSQARQLGATVAGLQFVGAEANFSNELKNVRFTCTVSAVGEGASKMPSIVPKTIKDPKTALAELSTWLENTDKAFNSSDNPEDYPVIRMFSKPYKELKMDKQCREIVQGVEECILKAKTFANKIETTLGIAERLSENLDSRIKNATVTDDKPRIEEMHLNVVKCVKKLKEQSSFRSNRNISTFNTAMQTFDAELTKFRKQLYEIALDFRKFRIPYLSKVAKIRNFLGYLAFWSNARDEFPYKIALGNIDIKSAKSLNVTTNIGNFTARFGVKRRYLKVKQSLPLVDSAGRGSIGRATVILKGVTIPVKEDIIEAHEKGALRIMLVDGAKGNYRNATITLEVTYFEIDELITLDDKSSSLDATVSPHSSVSDGKEERKTKQEADSGPVLVTGEGATRSSTTAPGSLLSLSLDPTSLQDASKPPLLLSGGVQASRVPQATVRSEVAETPVRSVRSVPATVLDIPRQRFE